MLEECLRGQEQQVAPPAKLYGRVSRSLKTELRHNAYDHVVFILVSAGAAALSVNITSLQIDIQESTTICQDYRQRFVKFEHIFIS